jgi:hypothetical protein
LTAIATPYLKAKGWTGNPGAFVTWWRRTHFENSMIDALLHRDHTPYREIGQRSVAHVLERAGIAHTMEEVRALVAEIEKLRCFPEVPEALARLARQKGQVVHVQWHSVALALIATPAGLLDLAPVDAQPDLHLSLTEPSAWTLMQQVMRGDKPQVRVEGNVQLAAEVNWLADHVRWDIEEDLARLLGDVPAHLLADGAHSLLRGLRGFLGARADGTTSQAPA